MLRKVLCKDNQSCKHYTSESGTCQIKYNYEQVIHAHLYFYVYLYMNV